MKCNDCGNNDTFIEAYKGWDKVYYGGTDEAQDSKSIDIESADDPRRCEQCYSVNIDVHST